MSKHAEFRFYSIPELKKKEILKTLGKELERDSNIVFAYVHGGFLERNVFRDVDVAVWIKNFKEALNYEVRFSVFFELKLKIPVDIHVLNEAPLPFKYNVFTKGKLLFSRNEKLRLNVVNNVVRQYIDLLLLRKYANAIKH